MAFVANGSSGASNNNNNNNNNTNNNDDSEGSKKKNLIIVVEEGSQDKLNELFEQTLKNKMPLQRPLKMRNFPPSFFIPPASGSKSPSVSVSHSRENSADSAFGSGNGAVGGGGTGAGAASGNAGGLQIHHSRAHSSPASLGKLNFSNMTMPMALSTGNNNFPPQQQQQQQQQPQQQQTPSKLSNIGVTGTNNNFTTSDNSFAQQKSFLHSRGRSYDQPNLYQHQQQLGDLPPGWEQATTADGKVYYINHNDKTTQWDDPRILHNQAPLYNAQSPLKTVYPVAPQNNPITQNVVPDLNKMSIASVSGILQTGLGPLPDGWEESVTNKGERYYINHAKRTTTWRDPRLSSNEWAVQEQQQQKLRDLFMERESLKRRQLEIKSHIGEDPFLGSMVDSHTRQESGDSGLSQSIPHTPDFLSTIDNSMDELSMGDSSMDTLTFNDNDIMLDPVLFDKLIEPGT